MAKTDTRDVVIKREPTENMMEGEENCGHSQINVATGENSASTSENSSKSPLRYISRRGRPPGGGYSMKPHAHYVSFSSAALTNSADLRRQSSIGSSSSLSSQDLLKSATSGSSDLDIRRFGFQTFDSDKNSFRCDGCDVVFSSRDTYAMHMLLRAKNESCVALPTSAISSNPENPTPREKFEKELRQQAMITALRNQAAAMTKAAAAMMPKASTHSDSLSSLTRSTLSSKNDVTLTTGSGADTAFNFNTLFSMDAYGFYVDPRQYRRFLEEYGLRASASTGSLAAMMEQLSCSVCGELFSNKDALAMHMMFHTREEEQETKSNGASTDLRSRSTRQYSSTFSPTSSLNESSAVSRGTRKSESAVSKKRERNHSEERELTAERVAELKRMAIESSLRSSSAKPGQTSRSSPRSKSTSQDTAVTSSAQTRPLSADDVMRFTKSGFKNIPKSPGPTFFSCPEARPVEDFDGKLRKKRHHSTLDEESMFDTRQMASESSKYKKVRYDGNLYDLIYRSSRKMLTHTALDLDGDAKVCDNHVSSASGPQDSDDTSEGSSQADLDRNGRKDEGNQASDYAKLRAIPYIDAIMSQDAVLVPIETTDDEDSNKMLEDKATHRDTRIMQASALDFSTSGEERKESLPRGGWYLPQDKNENGMFQSPPCGDPQELSPISNEGDRCETRQGLFHQQEHSDGVTLGRLEGRGHLATNGSSPSLRQVTASADTEPETEVPPRNPGAESISRVGEARYCPHCEILFLDVTLFHLHMGLHNVNNPWQCNTCGLVCTGRLEFNTHVLHY